MTVAARDYTQFFKGEKQVKIGIKLEDNKFLDVSALVRTLDGDKLTLELGGTDPDDEMPTKPESDVLITFWTGWSLCRCNALLIKKIHSRLVILRLTGPVIEKQAREYFRLDVTIPLCYNIPEKQLLPAVHEEWAATVGSLKEREAPVLVPCPGGFKVVHWDDQEEIAPRMVNLSGGGLRFKTQEYVEPGTLEAINLFLPLVPPRVICTVAETLRCNEILLGQEKGSSYIIATRFHFISDKDRETIIAFIFAEQRRFLSASVGKRI